VFLQHGLRHALFRKDPCRKPRHQEARSSPARICERQTFGFRPNWVNAEIIGRGNPHRTLSLSCPVRVDSNGSRATMTRPSVCLHVAPIKIIVYPRASALRRADRNGAGGTSEGTGTRSRRDCCARARRIGTIMPPTGDVHGHLPGHDKTPSRTQHTGVHSLTLTAPRSRTRSRPMSRRPRGTDDGSSPVSRVMMVGELGSGHRGQDFPHASHPETEQIIRCSAFYSELALLERVSRYAQRCRPLSRVSLLWFGR
jgi:hypothetical protein